MLMSKDITHEKIKQASEICYIVLYKAPHKIMDLDDLLYIKFMAKVALRGSTVLPHTLPPTSSTSEYHD